MLDLAKDVMAKSIRQRTLVVMIVFLLFAVALLINLFKVSVVDNAFYQEKANGSHFGTITIPANRGSIYDCNGKILAQSATVYKIYIDPKYFRQELETYMEQELKNRTNAASKGEVYQPVDYTKIHNDLITYLAQKLELEETVIREAMEADSQYIVLKNKVEKTVADDIMQYVRNVVIRETVGADGKIKQDTISFSAIVRETDTKRYYPQNSLAASVIGFTNGDGDGQYGIEAMYDEYLSGTDGKTISATDVNGNEMPYRYAKTYDAQDGNSLYLTIDTTLQTYLESSLEEMADRFGVQNRSCGIIMNAKTGAVLAMATYPGFDLNEPYVIADEAVAAYLDTLTGDAYTEAYIVEREKQWKNKAITELYQPGSVFKVVTASAGFEESVVKLTDSFTCNGHLIVYEGTDPIHCWKRAGHGTQHFVEALTNSCNPAFMEIGRRLGAEQFFRYFTAFGMTEKTGIDLPGEATSYYQSLEGMGPVELASCSFGQTNIVTPIEMITAYAAVINGGNLLKPYVVSKVVDADGNVVMTNETEVKRQVISSETSETMRSALEQVVTNNGGSNAYIKGYRIGGKSGTSQKIGGSSLSDDEEYIASYVCFAPADDPEIILLIMADEPNNEIGYYGSTVAVPHARKVMEKALPYLGYYPEYTAEEQANLDVKVPFLEDMTIEEAQKLLTDSGLSCEIIGEGMSVYSQMPITGTSLSKGSTVLLYTTGDLPEETATVPNVIGMTLDQANQALTAAGLNYIATGASTDRSDVRIQSQSAEAMSTVSKWTVIELEFAVNDQSG